MFLEKYFFPIFLRLPSCPGKNNKAPKCPMHCLSSWAKISLFTSNKIHGFLIAYPGFLSQ